MAFGLFKSKSSEPTMVIEFRIGDVVQRIGTYPDSRRPKSPPQTHHDVESCWVPPGQQVEVAGRIIHGPLYVGHNLAPAAHDSYWVQIEPALVDTTLAIGPPGGLATPPEEYWRTTFADLTPQQRGVYLDWLAAGRRIGELDPYFVRLFLWGLERRTLVDAQKSEIAKQEIPAILDELLRMRDEASVHRALENQIDELVKIIRVRELEALGANVEPPSRSIGWRVPLELQIGLGARAESGEKVDARWALAWARTNPAVSLRTAATRCEAEFDQLFVTRFAVRHQNGLTVKPLKAKLKVSYYPSSPGIVGSVEYTTRYSDIIDSAQLANPIGALVADCTDSLDSLSRLLGRRPESRGTLEAIELTPVELLEDSENDVARRFQKLADRVSIGDSTCSVAEVLEAAGVTGSNGSKKSDFTAPSRMLEKFGVGFEPDPRFDAHVPRIDDQLLLFELPEDRINTPTAEFLVAAAFLHLAAGVAGADGVIDDSEFEHLSESINEYGVAADSEVARLIKRLESYRRRPPSATQLKARTKKLDAKDRSSVLSSILAVAFADGNIAPSEVAALTKIYEAFGVPTEDLFAHLHSADTAGAVGTHAPANSVRGRNDGEIEPSASVEFKLDRSVIEHKARETELASALLGEIFADGDEVVAVPSGVERGRFGLEATTTEFLNRMLTEQTWSRTDLDQVAAEVGVLLDGALEQINEVAFDLADAPLWEGDDPVDVYTETIEAMGS